jgi:nitrogenase-stabilizing/protective protein
MNEMMTSLHALSSAEEFLEFFGVEYQPAVVHVNRLHIMKRFSQYLRSTPGVDALEPEAMRAVYKDLLERAYQDFVHSTAAQEKVFKVFQDQAARRVPLDALRQTLPSQR